MSKLVVIFEFEEDEQSGLIYCLRKAAFERQKDAAFWEGMGDQKLNAKLLNQAEALMRLSNSIALTGMIDFEAQVQKLRKAEING